MSLETRPPQLWLEQLAIGELPPDREKDLRSRYTPAQIQSWIDELKGDSEEALRELPAEDFGDQVRARMLLADIETPVTPEEPAAPGHAQRTEAIAKLGMRPRFRIAALAMASLVLLVLGAVALRMRMEPSQPMVAKTIPVPPQIQPNEPAKEAPTEQPPLASPQAEPEPEERLALAPTPSEAPNALGDPGVRIKSDALQLLAFLQVGSEIKPVHQGDTVCGGQFLQLHYLTTEPGYGMVISIDGAGNRVQHLPSGVSDAKPNPSGNAQAAPLQLGAVIPLPHSYELDQAPHFERFFFFMAEKPFALSDIEPALKRYQGGIADPLRWKAKLRGLPARIHATSLTLTKGCQP